MIKLVFLVAQVMIAFLSVPLHAIERFEDVGVSRPLIIMGGHWAPVHKAEYSDISRVCGLGFTHIFSYYTEGLITRHVSLEQAVERAMAFSTTVVTHCPRLGLVIGIPRWWIVSGDLENIAAYVKKLEAGGVRVSFWFSDEIIHQLIDAGFSWSAARERADAVLRTVAQTSVAPYIWVEPGNYNDRQRKILELLTDLPVPVRAFDEYVLSRAGRLSKSHLAFDSVLATLRKLKAAGGPVFPVCEINYVKASGISPLKEELATMVLALLADGADGLVFYEERWATDDTLKSLGAVLRIVGDLGKERLSRVSVPGERVSAWRRTDKGVETGVVLNGGNEDVTYSRVLPSGAVVIWPEGSSKKVLGPMEIMVYRLRRVGVR